jgi:hypothetical protein
MADENNSMDAEEYGRAEKLSQKISSIISNNRYWEHHPGNDKILKKELFAADVVVTLLYISGSIEDCRYSELSWKSRYRVDRVLEIIFELIETDEEEK